VLGCGVNMSGLAFMLVRFSFAVLCEAVYIGQK